MGFLVSPGGRHRGFFYHINHSPMRFLLNLLDNIAYLLVLLALGIYLLIFKVPGIVADFLDEEILNYDK
jgi:hypothetical protein